MAVKSKTLTAVAVAVNASLYTAVGYFTYFGIFVGGVRFWPAVVVPGVFSVLFGGLVGGLGAAIGIFVSDVLIHGDPFLSLTVGVPANFLGFYILGELSSRRLGRRSALTVVLFSVFLALSIVGFYIYGFSDVISSSIGVGLSILCPLLYLASSRYFGGWRDYIAASIVGLGVGSVIIGFGVWGYSQIFVMPEILNIHGALPYYMAIVILAWTFLSEIPFLILLVPPIVEALRRAFPSLTGGRT